MLRNSLSKFLRKPEDFRWWMAIAIPLWVGAGFILGQVVIGLLLALLRFIGVSFQGVSEPVFQATASGIIYATSIAIVIGLPWLVKKYQTSKKELGLDQPPTWTHLFTTPGSFIFYIILSFVLTLLASHLPFYNSEQIQETGFEQLGHGYEYFLAFLTLVIIAPVAEEVLFRGYLLGKLRKYVPLWLAILVTSLLFGVVHFKWNVGVDVFALSIVLCLLRVWTGRLAPSILLHMAKNAIAFYFLFINPLL